MGYNRKNIFFDLSIVEVSNDQIIQNEVSLGRWIVDALTLLLSLGESYELAHNIQIKQFGYSYIPNIYLPKGCKAMELEGSTIIDIRNNLLLDTEIQQSELYNYLVDGGIVDNVLIVYISSNPHDLKEINHSGHAKLIHASSFIDKAKNAINEGKGGVNAALKGDTQKPKNSWQDIREERLKKAINDFKRFDSVLFTGAGVSASAKLPDWKTLLKNLLSDCHAISSEDFDTAYKAMDFSNLITARYIERSIKADKATIRKRIKELLYPNGNIGDSELIKTICQLILRQKNLRSVITYNYDTLIEECLRKAGKPCFSVYRNNRDESNSFPVYHVHGIVFPNSNNDSMENIVLTEDDYHRVYSEVFDWSNVEQLHALTRCTCYFIGLSMNDPNLRRLLEVAQRDSGKSVRHYVFLERKSAYIDKNKREKDFLTREDMFADLGLNVIWYDGTDCHKELPDLLMRFVQNFKTK